MPRVTYRTNLLHSAGEVYAWHARPGAFDRLTPPFEHAELVSLTPGADGNPLSKDTRLVVATPIGPFRAKWHARHEEHTPGEGFVDVQDHGPFHAWRHRHRFVPLTPSSSTLEDQIDYELPLGALGRLLAGGRIRAKLDRMFAFRHIRTRRDLERHARYRGAPRLRIGVTGASGSIGSALCAYLSTAGHEVIAVRRAGRRGSSGGRVPGAAATPIVWSPTRGVVEQGSLEGLDAVIHLAGSPITARRWTLKRKDEVRESRVEHTRTLCRLLSELNRPPAVLLSASGIGYYGDRQADLITEDSTLGSGFLAEVARDWEAATQPALRAGVRVVVMRLGVVLAASGGMLRRILAPARLGLLGRLGSGKQYLSWIGLDDCLAAIETLVHDASFAGPVNIVSPSPVTQDEFTRTLADLLRRPRVLNLGSSLVRAVFGEMGDEILLRGQRVAPARLTMSGFRFETPDLASALMWELGLAPPAT